MDLNFIKKIKTKKLAEQIKEEELKMIKEEEIKKAQKISCYIVGHKDVPESSEGLIKKYLTREILLAIEYGYTIFCSNLLRGVDKYFYDVFLSLKSEYPNIQLKSTLYLCDCINEEICKDSRGEFSLFLERFLQSEIFENIGELTDEQKKLMHDKGYN